MQHACIACFCLATLLLVALEFNWPGWIVWLAGWACLVLQKSDVFRRRIGVLFVCVGLLAVAPIHTGRDTAHFIELGAFFAAVVLGPALFLWRRDPGVLDFRFWPRRLEARDIIYTLISIPLSWAVIKFYFFHVNPELPTHWPMPDPYTEDGRNRLLIGINAVGIWDELFFVNTVFAIFRSVLPFHYANIAQSFVYTSVLYAMAFTGMGPFAVAYLAVTQGIMYEKSKCLFYVLLVHLIVDFFLVEAILEFHYPDRFSGWFLP
ncbi:MAG: hypothetical protein GWN80_10995 [Gammaproteobacteria bacterium]|nr:hypothetical protein [Gammaproteobacteria bacterium]